MSYSPKLPIACAAVTLSIASHILSSKPLTMSGTSSLRKLRTPATKIGRALFEFKGRRMSIKQWALATGLSPACIQSRLRYGIPLDQPKSAAGRPKMTERNPSSGGDK